MSSPEMSSSEGPGSEREKTVVMEGFLVKKGAGTGIFGSGIAGRHNWLKRWFVLENEYLLYYETFDRAANGGEGAPVNRKGIVPVHNCEVTRFPHKERSCCFLIRHPDRRTVYLQAENEKLLQLWLDALHKASRLEFHGHKINMDEYYEVLGLDPAIYREQGTTPSEKEISKAYRKACVKCHPDKGGDPALFDKVQEAHEMLRSIKESEAEAKHFEHIEFVANIVKGPKGVGLGLVVQEDKGKGITTITRVTPEIKATLERPDDFGAIQADDVLVAIGNERVRGWPLNRVTERLNDFRVPVGSTVKLTFSRKIRKRTAAGPTDDARADSPNTTTTTTATDRDDSGPEDASQAVESAQSLAAVAQERDDLVERTRELERELDALREQAAEHEMNHASMVKTVRELETERDSTATASRALQAKFEHLLVISSVELEARGMPQPELPSETTIEGAHRRAIAAAEAADPSGIVLNRWLQQGDGASTRLRRLEALLSTIPL